MRDKLNADVERLRSQNAELSEARRNLEARLNGELRKAGAENECLRARNAELVAALQEIADLINLSSQSRGPAIARAALTGGKE